MYFKVATNDCLIAYAKSSYINCPNCTVAMAEVSKCYNKLITEKFCSVIIDNWYLLVFNHKQLRTEFPEGSSIYSRFY